MSWKQHFRDECAIVTFHYLSSLSLVDIFNETIEKYFWNVKFFQFNKMFVLNFKNWPKFCRMFIIITSMNEENSKQTKCRCTQSMVFDLNDLFLKMKTDLVCSDSIKCRKWSCHRIRQQQSIEIWTEFHRGNQCNRKCVKTFKSSKKIVETDENECLFLKKTTFQFKMLYLRMLSMFSLTMVDKFVPFFDFSMKITNANAERAIVYAGAK